MVVAPHNSLYAPFRWLSEHDFVTKSGETGLFAKVSGIDFECLTDEVMEQQRGRLVTALQSLEDIRSKHYLVKLDGAEIEAQTSENPVIAKTLEARREYLTSRMPRPLCTINLYLSLVHEPRRKVQ